MKPEAAGHVAVNAKPLERPAGWRAACSHGTLPRRLGLAATAGVASVWLVHGLCNKLLHGAPRHLAIVQSVPGFEGAVGERILAAVGVAEVGLAVWVLSGLAPHACAMVQTLTLLSMNSIELMFARHLLLWPEALLPVNVAFLALAWTAASLRGGATFRTRLRRHPLPIEARLEDCITITFALPADVLRPLVPPGLELETLDGRGFVAVALVQTRALRPAGLPAAFGQDFFLAGYRVFTHFRGPNGRSTRGLRILRSDADRARMVVAGNLLTHYRYHRCSARLVRWPGGLDVDVSTNDGSGDLGVRIDLANAALPDGSPFRSAREARRFAGPLPFTFDYEAETRSIVAIEARRTNWRPAPVSVDVRRMAFFDQPVFAGCTPVLAAAFHVRHVEYRWKRGVRYSLAQAVREVVR